MESWNPATEAEAAMRDVLRAGDQEQYFRVLARLDLLLPVSPDSAGRRSPGWGTWSSDGRTHVLAFTSPHAMRACLAEHAGSYRTVSFRELATQWPNAEWWLAINPGLPIEGYLPSWFVSQISRGDVRLPGRTLGSRARMDHASTMRARAVAQVPRRPGEPGDAPVSGWAAEPPDGARSAAAGPAAGGSRSPGGPTNVPARNGPHGIPHGGFDGGPSGGFDGGPSGVGEEWPGAARALPARPESASPGRGEQPSGLMDRRSAQIERLASMTDRVPGQPERSGARSQPVGAAGALPAGPDASGSSAGPGRSTHPADRVGSPPGRPDAGLPEPSARPHTPPAVPPEHPASPSEWTAPPYGRSESGGSPYGRSESTAQPPYGRSEPAERAYGRVARPIDPGERSFPPVEPPAPFTQPPAPFAQPPAPFTQPAAPFAQPAGGSFGRPVGPAAPPPPAERHRAADDPVAVPRREPHGADDPSHDPYLAATGGPVEPPPAVSGGRAPVRPAGSSTVPAERVTASQPAERVAAAPPAEGGAAPVPAERVAASPPAEGGAAPVDPPPPVAGEAEPHLGLGARLARLHEVSGAFSVVPVDAVEPPTRSAVAQHGDERHGGERHGGERHGGERPARGLWESKVPARAESALAESAWVESAWAASGEAATGAAESTSGIGALPEPALTPAGRNGSGPEPGEPVEVSAVAPPAPERSESVAPPAPERSESAAPGEPERSEPVAGSEPVADPGPVREREPEPVPGPVREPAPDAVVEPVDLSGYDPANSTEEDLLHASRSGNTDRFLSTLLLAKVLVPGHTIDPAGWPTEEINGARYLVTYTSTERLTERRAADQAAKAADATDTDAATDAAADAGSPAARPEAATVRFTNLIARWPESDIGFAVNPGTPIGATLSGAEVRTLAGWAAEVGLIDRTEAEAAEATVSPAPAPRPATRPGAPRSTAGEPLLMQRTIAPDQVPLYLERGYDRVSGFVHRASEIDHLRTPDELYRALGLNHAGSPFQLGDAEVYVLRWAAHCPSLYRIPFGGQTDAAMHAMQGWVIERAPFRGNGFAPSETRDVVAEFKVDSTRLPHGAQLWRLTGDGTETLIALFDADGPLWRRVGEG